MATTTDKFVELKEWGGAIIDPARLIVTTRNDLDRLDYAGIQEQIVRLTAENKRLDEARDWWQRQYAAAMADMEAEVEALRARAARLRTVALAAEWGWWDRYDVPGCPICHRAYHAEDCLYTAISGDLVEDAAGYLPAGDEAQP